jgi:hypothetical protein
MAGLLARDVDQFVKTSITHVIFRNLGAGTVNKLESFHELQSSEEKADMIAFNVPQLRRSLSTFP